MHALYDAFLARRTPIIYIDLVQMYMDKALTHVIKVKKFYYMLEIDIYRSSLPKYVGVLLAEF